MLAFRNFALFVLLLAAMGLAWLVLSSKSDEDKIVEAKRLGALRYLETVIPKTSAEFERVILYRPVFASQPGDDIMIVTGVFMANDTDDQKRYGKFTSQLRQVCSVVSEIACWEMLELDIDEDPRPPEIVLPKVSEQQPSETREVQEAQTDPPSSTQFLIILENETPPAGSDNGQDGTTAESSASVEDSASASAPQAAAVTSAGGVNGAAVAAEPADDPLAPQGEIDLSPLPSEPSDAAVGRIGIQRIQTILSDIGFDPGPIDGIAGPRTVAAIKSYERQRGLLEQGIPTVGLLEELEAGKPLVVARA